MYRILQGYYTCIYIYICIYRILEGYVRLKSEETMEYLMEKKMESATETGMILGFKVLEGQGDLVIMEKKSFVIMEK